MDAGRDASTGRRAALHGALADPHRLAIVDELTLSDRSPSELRVSLQIGSNLLAHHLDALERVGLIERLSSAGDGRRKYLRLVPERLSELLLPAGRISATRLLFVCTGNSARSQLAQALWNTRHTVPAESAGTEPAPRIHPEAVRAAARAGLNLGDAQPRAILDVAHRPDLVVTVCDIAHEDLGELGPETRLLHWSIPDPARSGEPSAFDDTLRRLAVRVDALAGDVRPLNRSRPPDRPRRSRP